MTHDEYADEISRHYRAMEWATVQRFGRGDNEGRRAGSAVCFSIGLLITASKQLDSTPRLVTDDHPRSVRRGRRAPR